MTDDVPLHRLVALQRVVHFEYFRLGKPCESPPVLRMVGAGFARSYRLYERSRFVSGITSRFFVVSSNGLESERVSALVSRFFFRVMMWPLAISMNFVTKPNLLVILSFSPGDLISSRFC